MSFTWERNYYEFTTVPVFLTALNLPPKLTKSYKINALRFVGLVAQRLEQRTHNAHEGIEQQGASPRDVVQITSVYNRFLVATPRSKLHLYASLLRLNWHQN